MVRTQNRRRFSLVAALSLLASLALAACGNDTATAVPAATTAAATTAAATTAAATTAAATTAAATTGAATTAAATTSAATTAAVTTGATTAAATTAAGTAMAGTTAPAMTGTTTAATSGGGGIVDKLITTFTPDKTGKKGGTLVYGYAGQGFDSLNPYYNQSSSGLSVITLVYDVLIQLDNNGKYFPEMLSELPLTSNGDVKVSADGKTQDVTLKLKPGLLWSDGQPLTSKDIAYTIKWLSDPNHAGIQIDQSGYQKITSVDTPDDTTAICHFNQTYGPVLNLLGFAPLPQHIFANIPINGDIAKNKELIQPTVVSGPFTLKEVVPDQKITLVRNDNYKTYGQPAYLDSIIFQVTADTTTAEASLQKGELDELDYIQEPDLAVLTGKPGIQVDALPDFGYEHLQINMEDPILKDPAVRHALDIAIDRNALITQTATDKNGLVASAVVPLSFPYDPKFQPPAQDVAGAKAALDAAGWVVGSDGIRAKAGTRLTITIATTSGNKRREQLEQILQVYYKAVGIELKPANVKSSQLFGSYSSGGTCATGKFQICMYTSTGSPDPDDGYSNFHSSNIPNAANKFNGNNWYRINDPIIDKALDAQRLEPDYAKRVAYWADFQTEYQKVEFDIPLYTRIWATAYSTKIANMKINPTNAGNQWNAVEWYLKG